jgi:uncharacterized damage-inducible protein DinB
MPSPLSTDPFDILLGHNAWALAQIIDRCAPLNDAQFHQPFPIGPGSLHATITHMIGCIAIWADRIAQRPVRPWMYPDLPTAQGQPDETRRFTTAQLREHLNTVADDFARVVARARADGQLTVVRQWPSRTENHTFSVAAAIIHVTNHGMHHRAQCMNMLRHLGHPVNADLDELEWQIAGEP